MNSSNDKSKSSQSKTQLIRLLMLMVFLAFLSWMGYRHQILGGGPAGSPTVDALCPFGGLESMYLWFKEGNWLRRIAPSSWILFIGVATVTLLGGRIFCGWICPLGAINEFVTMISRKSGIRKFELPSSLDTSLRFLKYIVLVVILYTTWRFGTLTFREFDPWAAWMHISVGWSEFGYGTLVLAATLFLGMFIERFWCRYLCPLGAALGLISRFSFIKVHRDTATCISCGKCHTACPVGLSPDKDTVQKNGECIVCGKCSAACPVPGTMKIGTKSIKISFLAVGVLGAALLISVISGAKLTGYWQTFAMPAQVTAKDSVDNVFGWMNIEQVAQTVALPVKVVLDAAGLPEDTPKDIAIKKLPGVNDEEVKDALRKYIKDREKRDSREKLLNPQELKGSITLNEICADYSIKSQLLLEKLGLPSETDMNVPVKDILKPLGREVQEVRDILKILMQQK